jgi:hypothetical protein
MSGWRQHPLAAPLDRLTFGGRILDRPFNRKIGGYVVRERKTGLRSSHEEFSRDCRAEFAVLYAEFRSNRTCKWPHT